jgi:hypothetical protein
MLHKPHVFTTCPKGSESSALSVKYQVTDASGRLLMIVKDRGISYDDIMKAAKCAGLKTFFARKVGSISNLERANFPIASSIVIVKPTVITPTQAPAMVSVKTYKIIRAADDKLLQLVKGPITKTHLDMAAKCAGFKQYTVRNHPFGHCLTVTSTSKLECNIYLRLATPKIAKAKSSSKPHIFNICDTVTAVKKPVKKATKKVKKSKKELINTAIAALTELSKII